MLSGRRKRDYEADSLAAQAGEGAGDNAAISPNEAAEVGVVTVADTSAGGSASDEDDQVLVLA